ncbi:hypothetical protein [Mucilaginibacter sp.]|jgi:hypothetical protein|uniref:hypothetical protein n=1 Tax=Mucilaginibacter sp. TaxID=1882438 RepID=UPI002BC821FC|nr:hypothetical protein [Mucilaginibacter sp.]HTI58576.1 hypothetical protein [Mucilaginibacter sp.]
MKANNFKWTVDTACFNTETTTPDIPKIKSMEVNSMGQSINLPGLTGHAGRPVDANLAIHFIKNFLNHFEITFFKDDEEALEKAEKLAATIENSDKLLAHFRQFHSRAKKRHGALLNLKYGITLEKDMILKTLSQPGCEGLRFYLCARTAPEFNDPYMHVSLIAVGVDDEGYDLNYNAGSATPNANMPSGQDVNTESLTLEYMPPPPYNFTNGSTQMAEQRVENAKTRSKFFDRFVLLNIAKYGKPSGNNSDEKAENKKIEQNFQTSPPSGSPGTGQ